MEKKKVADEGEGGDTQIAEPRLSISRRVPLRLTHSKRPAAGQPTRPTHLPPVTTVVESGAEPGIINEDEEQQRLAGLQLRDQLVRSSGLPQALSHLLSDSPSSLITSDLVAHPHSTLPPKTHSCALHQTLLCTQSPPSIGTGCLRAPLSRPVSLSQRLLHHTPLYSQNMAAPLETFGLVVTSAPVASRSARHNPSLPLFHSPST